MGLFMTDGENKAPRFSNAMFALSAERADLTHTRNCCSGKRADGDAKKRGGGGE